MFLKVLIISTFLPFIMAQTGEKCVPSSDLTNPNFIHHPTNCSKFFSCGSGFYKEMECPARLHFNLDKKVCDWPAQAGCKTTNAHQDPSPTISTLDDTFMVTPGGLCTPSKHRNNPKIAAYAGSCDKFLICSGIWTLMDCPAGLLFSVETGYCEHPHNAKCCPTCVNAPRKCSVEGETLPHPTNCRTFYVCKEGSLVSLNCSEGMVFNPVMKECISGLICNTDHVPPKDNNNECQIDDVLHPNYEDCRRFFICNGGVMVAQSCPPNSLFCMIHRTCQPMSKATCATSMKQ